MSKLEKLISKFQAKPSDVSFSDIEYLLKAYGYEEVRSNGSHHSFRNPEREPKVIIVPKVHGRRVKKPYIVQILTYLDLEQ
jgi:predicted RNA binding protein YcfA (HicA-like mRNA interferase family)